VLVRAGGPAEITPTEPDTGNAGEGRPIIATPPPSYRPRITLNGEDHPLAGARVVDVLQALGIDPARRGVAVAINGTVAPRATWVDALLSGGETVEIIRPLQGG
jgi:sulfur carrier protein